MPEPSVCTDVFGILAAFRNVFEFGGSFHCVTTDIRRKGLMQSYFKQLDAAEAAASNGHTNGH